jgi:F-type H+-transporting ATPase subunit gamma
MAKTREIKKRIKAVGNIRRITKTMQLIAAAKFSASQQRAVASKPYTEGVFELVRELAATASNLSHPLIVGPTGKAAGPAKELTLVITSDRGLCGPYNSSILRTAMQHFRETPAAQTGVVEVAGKKGVNFLKFNKIEMSQQHNVGDKPTFAVIEAIAQSFMDRFIRGEVSTVRVVFMKYLSAGRQRPEVMQLLPLKPPAKTEQGAKAARGVDYEFSPPQEELLNDLIPAAVKTMLYQAFNDAIVSEHVARMVAMKSATDAAGKMSKRLTRQFNRARQAQITTELTEIISGAAALS